MSSSKHPSNDDEQMAVVRALVLDAIRCAIPRADSSTEEQVYVLGMQERFNDLARIIERLIERRALAGDSREWTKKLDGVRSLLEKAKAVRGSIGKDLDPLVDRLPRQLPGEQPSPNKKPTVRSTGIIPGQFEGIPHWRLKATRVGVTERDSNPYFPDSWSRPGAEQNVKQPGTTQPRSGENTRPPSTATSVSTLKAIKSIEAEPLRTGVKQAESPDAQKNEKTTISAEIKSPKLQSGKRCKQIVDEVKKIKYQRVDVGKTVSEIQSENPNFLVWKVRENLSPDDRELFDHPNRWESKTGASYAYGLLAKEYARSWTTIRDWVKAWNKSQRPTATQQGSRK